MYSSPEMDKTPAGAVTFHGPFGRDTLYVTANDLPEHAYVDISFDLLILRSWDGSVPVTSADDKPQPLGPDYFRLGIHGGATLMYSTFSNVEAEGFRNESKQQSYPSQIPGDTFTPGTGAVARNSLGYHYADPGPPTLVPMDATYHVHFVVPHKGGQIMLEMSGINLQDLHDESWGVTAVQIKALAAGAVKKPSEAEIAAAFKAALDPGSADLPGAFQTLIDGGDGTADWISRHVKAVTTDGASAQKYIQDLEAGDDKMDDREAAHKGLMGLGHAVEPALRDARREAGGEQRLRIDWALATFGVRKPDDDTRAALLATRALEVIGTPKSLELRKKLVTN
jgi:hypothetical protein